jgi:hypothetical protein
VLKFSLNGLILFEELIQRVTYLIIGVESPIHLIIEEEL